MPAAGMEPRPDEASREPIGREPRTTGVARYRLVEEWHVPASADRVYELLSRPREYPAWWSDAFLRGAGDDGPAAPGKRAWLLTRGRLPYRLRWELTCVEAVAPSRLVSGVRGDFVGTGTWTLTEVDGGTRVVLDWDVEVSKPVVRHLTPLLRPLFAWNHRWAMQRGQERIVGLLEHEASPASPARGSRSPVPGLRRRSA